MAHSDWRGVGCVEAAAIGMAALSDVVSSWQVLLNNTEVIGDNK
jgi:hypothetical protein